jgi:hypothetical protein
MPQHKVIRVYNGAFMCFCFDNDAEVLLAKKPKFCPICGEALHIEIAEKPGETKGDE